MGMGATADDHFDFVVYFVAYLVVRHMDAPWDKKARMSAVIGIIGALDVPVVFMAIRWWNAKLHPVVLGKGGGGMEGICFLL